MTVSDVAFSPRQCPAQPSCAQLKGKGIEVGKRYFKYDARTYFPSGLSHLMVTLRLFEASMPS